MGLSVIAIQGQPKNSSQSLNTVWPLCNKTGKKVLAVHRADPHLHQSPTSVGVTCLFVLGRCKYIFCQEDLRTLYSASGAPFHVTVFSHRTPLLRK